MKKFLSRKLLMALFGVAISVFGVEMPSALQEQIINLIMIYIGSQGAVDAVEKFKQ